MTSDLLPQIAATHRFMPGMRLERDGDVRQCQGLVLASAFKPFTTRVGDSERAFDFGALAKLMEDAPHDPGLDPAQRDRIQDTRDRLVRGAADPAEIPVLEGPGSAS